MSEPIRYHVAPDANEATRCYAKKKCRYGFPLDDHPDTPAAALEWVNSLRYGNVEQTHSKKFAHQQRLAAELREVGKAGEVIWGVEPQYKSEIKRKIRNGEATNIEIEEDELYDAAIKRRNEFEDYFKTVSWDDTAYPPYDDSVTVKVDGFEITNNTVVGVANNRNLAANPELAPIYAQLDNATLVWAERLSPAEMKALYIYKRDSSGYTKASLGLDVTDDEKQMFKHIETALKKAPKLETPITVYSGINSQKAGKIKEAAAQGEIQFHGVQSMSLNPALVNSFMQRRDWADDGERIAVETQIDRCASLSGLHVLAHEMEILLPQGNYRVASDRGKVQFLWELNGAGQTSDHCYRIEPLSEP